MFSASTVPENNVTTSKPQPNYNGIDLAKFLCAILVFIIHVPPFQGDISGTEQTINFWLQEYICRLAVPFYFITSSFFLFMKMPLYNSNANAIKNYCFKALRLLGLWIVLSFAGSTGQLWYLSATIVAVTLLGLCLHWKIKLKYIGILACLFYAIGLLGDSYHRFGVAFTNINSFKYISKLYGYTFKTTRNGVFMGFIFILIGVIIAHKKICIKKRNALIGLIISLICMFAEVYILKRYNMAKDYNMTISLLPASFFFFSLAYTIQLKDRAIYKHLRNISTLIYFSHLVVNYCVLLVFGTIESHLHISTGPFVFPVTLISTLILSIGVEWLSHKNKFKWLQWLYS